MNEHSVVIVGAGPTGLMLAGELALAGIDVAVYERRSDRQLDGSRAGGLHSRSIELLDQRGIAERFFEQGRKAQVASFAWIPLDISDFPTRHNYGLALGQQQIESRLAEWVNELGVAVQHGCDVTGFVQDGAGVEVQLANGHALRTEYLVGCDGGRSRIRKVAGIDFAGWYATISHLIAEVQLAEEPDWGLHRDARGIRALSRMEDGNTVRVLVTEDAPGRTDEPDLRYLRETMVNAFGSDFGVHSPAWISRFSDMARLAASYRNGRVLLAGDAAHVHYPAGGQGLNIGLQDAVNLGWKLAQVVRKESPQNLLDTYHTERYPVAAEVLHNTLAQVALLRTDDRSNALRNIVEDLLALDEPRKRLAAMISGLDICYASGEPDADLHPLTGRRMPDVEIADGGGIRQFNSLMHDARPVLINFSNSGEFDITPWNDRILGIDARCSEEWTLPVIGAVPSPAAVLVRPDGYVAWAGEGGWDGLENALHAWFGRPTGHS